MDIPSVGAGAGPGPLPINSLSLDVANLNREIQKIAGSIEPPTHYDLSLLNKYVQDLQNDATNPITTPDQRKIIAEIAKANNNIQPPHEFNAYNFGILAGEAQALADIVPGR